MKARKPLTIIKVAREKKGITQAELAVLLGNVSTDAVRSWEHGRFYPSPALRPKLEAILEISLAEALSEDASSLDTPPQRMLDAKPSLEEKNREQMLLRVRSRWIEGVLKNSLYLATLITLELQEQPNAVFNPWRLVVQESHLPERTLPAGTRLIQVYDEVDGSLLILGEPGAGKTTLLLDLTKDLINRAKNKEIHQIPVIFNLSSWAEKRLPLADWMVEELVSKYQVPKKLAYNWISRERIFPLLDGLDEVVAMYRSQCVETINAYRQEHGMTPLVVCSRRSEYFSQEARLFLHTAVIVQPLTFTQVEEFLAKAGKSLAAVRLALQQDETLREMASNPLMLSTIALTYRDQPIGAILTQTSRRRHQILENYVERVLHRGPEKEYSLRQTKQYLSWLAWQMLQSGQTEFYIERLQMHCLPSDRVRRSYRNTIVRSIYSLQSAVIGALFAWVFGGKPEGMGSVRGVGDGLLGWLGSGRGNSVLGWMAPGIGGGLEGGGMFGLLLGLIFIVVTLLLAGDMEWKQFRGRIIKGLGLGLRNGGLSGGLIGGMCGLLFFMSSHDLSFAITQAVGFGAFTGHLIGLVSFLVAALRNESDEGSLSSSFSTRLIDGAMIGLCGGGGFGIVSTVLVTPQQGLLYGFIVGVAFALTFGFGGGTHLIPHIGKILPAEISQWNWQQIKQQIGSILLKGVAIGMSITIVVALVLGSAASLLQGLAYGWKYGFVYGLIVGSVASVAAVMAGILNKGWSSNLLDKHQLMRPNEGIRKSLSNSLFAACFGPVGGGISGIMIGLAFGFLGGLPGWPVLGTGFAIIIGIVFAFECFIIRGGIAYLSHYILRWKLWRTGCLPWRYVHFLDFAANAILLRKVGGGYIFIHRLLLEHFASYHQEASEDEVMETAKRELA